MIYQVLGRTRARKENTSSRGTLFDSFLLSFLSPISINIGRRERVESGMPDQALIIIDVTN